MKEAPSNNQDASRLRTRESNGMAPPSSLLAQRRPSFPISAAQAMIRLNSFTLLHNVLTSKHAVAKT